MGFFGLAKPKWRHADVTVRRAALEALTSADEGIILKLALNDVDAGLRIAAANQVTREDNLQRLLESTDPAVVAVARARLSGVSQKLIKDGTLDRVRALLDAISEGSALAEIACQAKDPAVRAAACDRLLAQAEPSTAALTTIAIQDASGALAQRVLARVERRADLKEIARKAKHAAVRSAAENRMATVQQEVPKPTSERRRSERAKRLGALLERFLRVVVTVELAQAESSFAAADSEFAAAMAGNEDLGDDASVLAARAKRAQAVAAIDIKRSAVAAQAEAESVALAARVAFLDALAASSEPATRTELLARWEALLPVSPALRTDLDARFAQLISDKLGVDVLSGNRRLSAAEAEELTQLCVEGEALIVKAGTKDRREAEFRYQILHKRWMQLTATCDPQLPDRLRFLAAWNGFKDERRAARERRDAVSADRLALLDGMLIRAERLAAETPAADGHSAQAAALKQLQMDWRAVGAVPDRLLGDRRARFDALLQQAWEPLQALRAAEDWQRFGNVAKAEALIVEAAALSERSDLGGVAKAIRAIQQQWKQLGGLPRERDRDLWQAFKTACDVQYDRCKVYFAELDAKRDEALTLKREYLAEAEKLSSQGSVGLAGSVADRANKDAAAERLKELQRLWREAGPAPREHDDALWTSFRAACDRFFQSHNSARDQEFQQNLGRKEALCVEAEKLAAAVAAAGSTPSPNEREKMLRLVKDIQTRWKPIGFVPRERHGELNDRFRKACDAIWALKDRDTQETPEEQAANLAAKQELCVRLEALIAAGGSDLRTDAEQLRLRWRETGPVPSEHREQIEQRWKGSWTTV